MDGSISGVLIRSETLLPTAAQLPSFSRRKSVRTCCERLRFGYRPYLFPQRILFSSSLFPISQFKKRSRGKVAFRTGNRFLLVVLLSVVVDNVEELELVNTLGGGDDAEPVTELLLLEELLGPVENAISTMSKTIAFIFFDRQKRTGT